MNAEPGTTPHSWSATVDVTALLTQPAVRSALEACSVNATTGVSAEEFTARVAAALPFKHMERGYLRAVERGRSQALKRGYKTGKTTTERLALPPGTVIAAVLCSLARNSQPVTAVEQYDNGAVLTAEIPSDARTFGGTLRVEIRTDADMTVVDASAHIPGQLYDWGKSKKTLATLIADIPALMIR